MLHSKTLNLNDYTASEFTEHQHIENVYAMMKWNSMVRVEHPHRKWEYGIILNALRKENVINILDVGGGGSIFAPAATVLGMNVIQVDPGHSEGLVKTQSQLLGKHLSYIKENFMDFNTDQLFDAVVAISVIEHVPDDLSFLRYMGEFVKSGGILAITTDFHPDGVAKSAGHFRTYNEESLLNLKESVAETFDFYGDYDYTHFDTNVFDYTFASMVLKGME